MFEKTAATILDEAGLSAWVIADQLGHSKSSMTQDEYPGRTLVDQAAAAAAEAAAAAARAQADAREPTLVCCWISPTWSAGLTPRVARTTRTLESSHGRDRLDVGHGELPLPLP